LPINKTTGRRHPRLDKQVNCPAQELDELPVEKQARRAGNEANSGIHLGFHRHASFQRLTTRLQIERQKTILLLSKSLTQVMHGVKLMTMKIA
jgi:hypothetical protein